MADSLFARVDEVQALLGVSRAKAYRIIKALLFGAYIQRILYRVQLTLNCFSTFVDVQLRID